MKTKTSGLPAAKARWPIAGTPFKKCPACKNILPRNCDYFYILKLGGFSSNCKKCNIEKSKKYLESKKRAKTSHQNVKNKANAATKLKPDDVRLILEVSTFLTTKQIAEKFDISESMVRKIITGKSWWWV